MKARSFAMPSVEPGCIIEYRWREVRKKSGAHYLRLQFQRDIPVRRVQYLIKPYDYPGLSFNSLTMHGQSAPWVKEKNGFYSTTMTNMPAMLEEARMPPEDQVKTWMLVYYAAGDKRPDPDKYWSQVGKDFYENNKSLIKPNDEVKKLAATLIAEAKTDDEKLVRLYEFCQTRIKNWNDDASGLTEEEREKLKDNKNPGDTLKHGAAELSDIKVENVADYNKPLTYTFHIRVPGYAQRTGKRIFIQPAFFRHGVNPLFATAGRKHPIYFAFPWSEDDHVQVELPQGYALDNADAPAPFGSGKISEYKPALSVTSDGKMLVYKRTFFFGGGNSVLFPLETYPAMKGYFDQLHKEDNHNLALKQSTTASN